MNLLVADASLHNLGAIPQLAPVHVVPVPVLVFDVDFASDKECNYSKCKKTIVTITHLTSKIPATLPGLKTLLMVVSFKTSDSIFDFSIIIF